MARSRNIKPGFFKNEDLSDVKRDGRLLFIGLWTLCDRRGVVEDRPKRIRAEIFPYDDITVKEIDKHLSDLEKFNFLIRYKSDGVSLIYVPKFRKHQSPHPKESSSDFNLPSDNKNKENTKNTSNKSHLLSSDDDKDKSVTSKLQGPLARGGEQDMKDESCILNHEYGKMNYESGSLLPDEDDPYSIEVPDNTHDVIEICKLATTRYKNTQYPSQVTHFVKMLLEEMEKEKIILAINNVSDMFDQNDRPHDRRPDFGNQFTSAQAVKEMAEKPVTAPQSSERANSDNGKKHYPAPPKDKWPHDATGWDEETGEWTYSS